MLASGHCAWRRAWREDWRRRCARLCAAVLASAVTITAPAASIASTRPQPRRPYPAAAPAFRLATPRHPTVAHRTELAHGAPVPGPGSALAPVPGARPAALTTSLRGEIALHFALAQRGKPYVYGSTGLQSYDCSGLTQRAWRAAGVAIPRTTRLQARTGSPVPLGQIKRGDLVIFYRDASHVGIYAGNGTVVVAQRHGTTVTLEPMESMPVYAVRRPR